MPSYFEAKELCFRGAGSYTDYRWRYRQKAPWVSPLPYRREVIKVLSYDAEGPTEGYMQWVGNACQQSGPWQMRVYSWNSGVPEVSRTLNDVRRKFVDLCGEQSQWLNNLNERRQTAEMLCNRVVQFWEGLRLLRKGQPFYALRRWGYIGRVPKGFRLKSKDWSSQFLEVHFGWVPLVQDIHAAMSVLEKDIPHGPIRARARTPISWSDSGAWYGGRWSATHSGTVRALMQADVEVSNPNLHLAAKLGIVNPLTVAWEAVPFSFVVDWFSNVGQWLGQYTDFVGLSLSKAFYTYQVTATCSSSAFTTGQFQSSYGRMSASSYVSTTERTLGVPPVTLKRRPTSGLSLTRGVTSIALIVQKFLKGY